MSGLQRAEKAASFFRGRIISGGEGPASIVNIANIVTAARIMLAPFFFGLLLTDDGQYGPLRYCAAALFILAIITDSVDGHLARTRNLVTSLGIILDPVADKILIGGALIALSILGELSWWITAAIILRECGITIFRFAILAHTVVPASRGGKLKTVAQAVAVSLFLLAPWNFFGAWAGWLSWIIMALALILTLYTGVEYLWQAWRHRAKA
ncbi:MAG: CDP-diacylglycerol--glycerol-3-phosphate 3-phosphatidyltransferase [Rhodoglobus sp.]